MALDFSSFIAAHISYFGIDPALSFINGAVRIASSRYQFPSSCIPQVEKFYRLRLQNKHTSKDDLTDEEYKYLENALEIKSMGKIAVAICLRISYNKFGIEYRRYKGTSLKELHAIIKELPDTTVSVKINIFTWDGVTKTTQEWADSLGISTSAFRRRYIKYGLSEKLFATKEDIKNLTMQSTYPEIIIGTPEWRALSSKQPELTASSETKRRREPLDISLSSATNLIAAMIKDAVDNVKTRDKKYFESSVQFLTNQSGYLRWLLDACPHCNTEYILNFLRNEYSKYLPVNKKTIEDIFINNISEDTNTNAYI